MKKYMLILPLVLIGCGKPIAPAQVYALASGVTVAETLALNYTKLPACPTTNGICSDPLTKSKIKAYGQKAYDAVKALEASSAAEAPALYSVAQAALVAFQEAIPVTTTK